jgi:Mrp family chromosome partitioning ATPase
MKRYPGLCDYLFGTVPIEEAVRETSFPNLHIMTCGTIPTNPAELIASKHMQTFLNMMKPKYDYILIDHLRQQLLTRNYFLRMLTGQ